MKGKVYLVGAGPGDPELLTLKALRLIREADVILHDDLVSAEILAFAPRAAHIRNIGKRCGQRSTSQSEINALLIAFASFGVPVVRLKGGDPLVFGRAGEEMAALRRVGIEFEVVPGITSALSAAASIQLSLTHRDIASTLVFLPGHHAEDSSIDLRALAASRATFVIYMPGHDYRDIAGRLLSAELNPDTPCAIVAHAMASDEQVHIATIATLSESPRLPAPSILIVGDVVGQARTGVPVDPLHFEAPQSLFEPAVAFTQAERNGSLAR